MMYLNAPLVMGVFAPTDSSSYQQEQQQQKKQFKLLIQIYCQFHQILPNRSKHSLELEFHGNTRC